MLVPLEKPSRDVRFATAEENTLKAVQRIQNATKDLKSGLDGLSFLLDKTLQEFVQTQKFISNPGEMKYAIDDVKYLIRAWGDIRKKIYDLSRTMETAERDTNDFCKESMM